jgi:hypothetical protein
MGKLKSPVSFLTDRRCQCLGVGKLNKIIYPAMTAFTDQYSLPNIFSILVSYK